MWKRSAESGSCKEQRESGWRGRRLVVTVELVNVGKPQTAHTTPCVARRSTQRQFAAIIQYDVENYIIDDFSFHPAI
jgi:hypothetical protein